MLVCYCPEKCLYLTFTHIITMTGTGRMKVNNIVSIIISVTASDQTKRIMMYGAFTILNWDYY